MSGTLPTVVQIGAGAIGRGFLGQLWSEGGYETIFVDTNGDLVQALNRAKSYPLHLVANDGTTVRQIAPVRAILASDRTSFADAVASCAFTATAVGASHLEAVAGTLLVPALRNRTTPLNVLLCENGSSVHDNFARGIGTEHRNIHAVETVVGRMVPSAPPDNTDLLAVYAEPFHELPFKQSQWHGNIPQIPGLVAVPGEQFPAYELRKLFLHNGGHALLAYHGYLHGYTDIWQCAEDPRLVAELRGFWTEIKTAIHQSIYCANPLFADVHWEMFTRDLLQRFRNKRLADSVLRVGRDPVRKIAAGDRLVGAGVFAYEHGVRPIHAARAIAAALRFAPFEDAEAMFLERYIEENGVRAALREYSGLAPESFLVSQVEKELNEQGQRSR